MKVLYVIDTGSNYDRPVQKGQWTLEDIPTQGSEIINKWLKEKTRNLVEELKYAELSGTGKIEVRALKDDYDIEVTASVKIRPATKKKTPATAGKEKVTRRAAR